jgi:hypothetical protein
MNIEIPKIGMTFSRVLMPQLGPEDEFKKNLDKADVKYKEVSVNPKDLKASQSEFDLDKVSLMMIEPRQYKSGVIISNDNYILDGHHRWIVAFNKNQKLNVVKVDLPILELMRLAKTFENTTYKPIVECVKSVIYRAVADKRYK